MSMTTEHRESVLPHKHPKSQSNRGSVEQRKHPERQSQHVSTCVKGVLISGANCSGKSYMLNSIRQSSSISNVVVFEMDSLQYYWSKVLEKKLPIARQKYLAWHSEQESSALLEELSSNLSASSPEAELIKLKLLELLMSSDKFVTVLPHILRNSDEGMRFIELLESYFRVRLVNIALVPGKWRYALNFCLRLRVWNVAYVKRALADRQMIISETHNYDYVVRNNLHSKSKRHFLAVLNRIFG